MLKLNIYAAVVGFFLTVTAPVTSARERIYFFGNSYIDGSGGMEKMVKALLEEGLNTTVDARSNTRNGARLTTQLQYLDGTLGSGARTALITGTNTNWDLVVLQGQSAIPAYIYSDLWYESLEAGVEINKLLEPTGAVTMFLLTWGRQRGLKDEPFFPNFRKMQEYLTYGYRQFQLAANNPRSFVAPAGIAFELIYDDTIARGGFATDSPFKDLYAGDGSHPSTQGSYLAACVIYAAYTGLSVAELEWAPGNIGAGRRDYLQSMADQAVFDDDTFYPSRWDLPDFVGPGDKLEPTAMPTIWVDKATPSPTSGPTASPLAAPSAMPTPTFEANNAKQNDYFSKYLSQDAATQFWYSGDFDQSGGDGQQLSAELKKVFGIYANEIGQTEATESSAIGIPDEFKKALGIDDNENGQTEATEWQAFGISDIELRLPDLPDNDASVEQELFGTTDPRLPTFTADP
jgi:hypothetical protein